MGMVRHSRICRSVRVPFAVVILLTQPVQFGNEWLVVMDIIGPGKLFQKEGNDDTGISVNTIRKGKIRVKSLVVEYG